MDYCHHQSHSMSSLPMQHGEDPELNEPPGGLALIIIYSEVPLDAAGDAEKEGSEVLRPNQET